MAGRARSGPEPAEEPEPEEPPPERGLVWGAAAARELRERFRVCGRLLGPPGRGRKRKGARGPRLPLQLRPEELRLLRESADGAAAVGLNWDPPAPNGSPTGGPAPPGDPAPQRRFRVFRELWGRGLHVTGGGKFGGDFLVYPGPPAVFHAVAVALSPPQPRSCPPPLWWPRPGWGRTCGKQCCCAGEGRGAAPPCSGGLTSDLDP